MINEPMNRLFSTFAFAALIAMGMSSAFAENGRSSAVLPVSFTLDGARASQKLVVVDQRGEHYGPQVAEDQITWHSSDEAIVQVREGRAVPVGDGQATLIARLANGEVSEARVEVKNAGQARPIDFRQDIQSIVSRHGCNTGACHGALAGKGGFRLTLGAYDADADYFSMTREARGRRIEMSDPGQSLVLAKPTGALPHKGGLKLRQGSDDYNLLADWIASGARGPSVDDAKLLRISVTPESSLLAIGDTTQVLVSAHYDDGRTVDVTHWAKFTATDEVVLTVDSDGVVKVGGSGEGAVLVWFGSKVILARMTVPFPYDVPAEVYANAPRKNFIDELNLAQLETLRLRPSPPCDPETFIRRATLDTVGRLPTLAERDEYLSDTSVDAKQRLIARLLASSDYVDYWSYRFSDMLLINGTRLRPAAVKSYYEWVHDAVSKNMPWDQFVQEILTATGISTENGATNFYALHQTPEEMTENACQAFMGLSIGCAKCHNHPLEKWTNDQYYGMANLFARVRAKGWGGESRNGDGIRTLYVAASGDLIQPRSGKPQPPAPLDAEPLAIDDPADRRETLAVWMTSPENPYFSRAIANRIWSNFFGRGLVEQVDDLRQSNPASCEPLLAATAQHLVDAKFDLKRLMRTILESETYARSSDSLDDNRAEEKYLSRYYPRRLMAEVLLDAIDQVLDTSTDFKDVGFPGADVQATAFYPSGTRAIELYDSAVRSYFLDTFGRNPREITCDCERSAEPNLVQVLHLSNGETLNPKLKTNTNCIHRSIDTGDSNEVIVRNLFAQALSRSPSDSELKRLLVILSEYGDDRATALEDVAWSVLTSTEFIFNH